MFLLMQAEAGQPRRYGVRVPLGPLPPSHKITTITASTHNAPFPTSLSSTPRSPKSFDILPSPPFEHFVHPSTALSLAALAEAKAPLISFHLATFADAFAIGFTAPHGVFDATGMGMVLKALECALSGRCEWEVPPVQEVNPLEASAAEFVAEHPVAAEASGWRKAVSGVAGAIRLGGHMLWDKVWFGVEEKGVFIGEELMRGGYRGCQGRCEEARLPRGVRQLGRRGHNVVHTGKRGAHELSPRNRGLKLTSLRPGCLRG